MYIYIEPGQHSCSCHHERVARYLQQKCLTVCSLLLNYNTNMLCNSQMLFIVNSGTTHYQCCYLTSGLRPQISLGLMAFLGGGSSIFMMFLRRFYSIFGQNRARFALGQKNHAVRCRGPEGPLHLVYLINIYF